MRSNASWLLITVALLAIIAGLVWHIMIQPATVLKTDTTPPATTTPSQTAQPDTTTPTSATQPLSARVTITEPLSGSAVGKTFTVSGKAPGNWYFEASFPIMVRDMNDNVIGRTHANAQGDWMTTELVAFTTTVQLEGSYKGPATLILMRDNPSGLPENDDSISIPIVIQ